MVSESICMSILEFMRGRTVTETNTRSEPPKTKHHSDAGIPGQIYRHLLGRYDLPSIDAGIRWLELGEYFTTSRAGIIGATWYVLTEKGKQAADVGAFSEGERLLLYQDQKPHEVFIAHQFNSDDSDLVTYIRDSLLIPLGFTVTDGRADGLEDFRSAILAKIKRARFFLCLLTKRRELAEGRYASSVWLYQETGAAVAFGKRPLLLVEHGVDSEYVGELQSIYEHIVFTRSNHPSKFEAIGRRFLADLDAHAIPKPTPRRRVETPALSSSPSRPSSP